MVSSLVEHAPDLGIGCFTLYAFSSDNWSRPAPEVKSIFWLLGLHLRAETERMRKRGVRLEVIGRRDRIPQSLRREIDRAERATSAGRRLHLRIAIDYSSRYAIADDAAKISAAVSADQQASCDRMHRLLTQARSAKHRDVDLLIRTGGEKRLSDFLLWESAYAELFFTDRMWPDFGVADLLVALQDFHRRERRFGGIPAAAAEVLIGGAR